MKERHIILRSRRPATRDVFRGGAAAFNAVDTPPGRVSIEVEDISKNEIKTLANEADVVAIAPTMPMRLIDPVIEDGQAQPAAGTPPLGCQGCRRRHLAVYWRRGGDRGSRHRHRFYPPGLRWRNACTEEFHIGAGLVRAPQP
jgi:hypothetical protein